jgi:hypothetical protein
MVSTLTFGMFLTNTPPDTIMMRLAKLSFDDCMGKSLFLQEERAMRPGRGSRYSWYLSAAMSLTATQLNPSDAKEYARQAGDRIAKMLHRVLSLYDDPSEETLATEVLLEEQHTHVQEDSAPQDPLTADVFVDAGLRLDEFDYTGASGFMMDDFCFFNMPPLDLDDGPLYSGS